MDRRLGVLDERGMTNQRLDITNERLDVVESTLLTVARRQRVISKYARAAAAQFVASTAA